MPRRKAFNQGSEKLLPGFGPGTTANISGNTIDVGGRGIAISNGASPTVSGNDICTEHEGIWAGDDASPELGENTVC